MCVRFLAAFELLQFDGLCFTTRNFSDTLHLIKTVIEYLIELCPSLVIFLNRETYGCVSSSVINYHQGIERIVRNRPTPTTL